VTLAAKQAPGEAVDAESELHNEGSARMTTSLTASEHVREGPLGCSEITDAETNKESNDA
jgi:hypothetical protein